MSQPTPAEQELHRRLSEMTELAGGLAHELRNPLSTMMINLKLLAEDLGDERTAFDDVRRRALIKVDGLRHEAQRLQLLFDEYLSLTGPCRPRRCAGDLNRVVQKLADFVQPMIREEGISLSVEFQQDPLPGVIDENLIRQALLNLVINARQAMAKGGELSIATSADGDDLLVSVADTGVGIAASDRERILRPFFSTKATGNGLGLSITQRIVHEHGGKLTIDDNPGGGTIVTLRLPRSSPDDDGA